MTNLLAFSVILAQVTLPIPWTAIAIVGLGIYLTSPKKEKETSKEE